MVSPLVTASLCTAFFLYIPFPACRLFALTIAAASVLFLALRTARPSLFRRIAVFESIGFSGQSGCNVLLLPLILGTLCGIWTAARMERFTPGLPVEAVSSVKGKLLDDPRSFVPAGSSGFASGSENERGMANLALAESGAVLPGISAVRSSAEGRVMVFFPAGTMPRLREFGRGADVYLEGRFLPGQPGSAAPGDAFSVPRFQASSVHIVRPSPGLEQLRTHVRTSLLERLKTTSWGGLAAALLLGTRENLDGSLARSFNDAGLSHMLALSGMHLAFLSALLAFVLKRPLGKKGAILAGLCFILLYVFLVGPQPSLIRAAVMYVLGSCFVLSGVVRQPPAILAAAFFIQIIMDPSSALTLSFVLSYLALTGIFVLSRRMEVFFRGRLPSCIGGSLGLSVGAFLFTAPVVMVFFGILRPVGIPAGLVIAPLSGVFMALSLAWLPAANLFPGLFLDRLLVFLQALMKNSMLFFANAPGLKAPALCAVVPPFIAVLLFLAKRHAKHRNYLAPFA